MIESVSRRAFGGSSGTYNVRASELARERKLNTISANVIFLDDTQHSFQIEKKAKGSVLYEQVFQHLELVEKDYFGLQFGENGHTPNLANTDTTRWLDANKSVKKQAGGSPQLWLAVRFYPPEPSRLVEEYTRYQLCLQLRRLLLDGRMSAPRNTALLLASFTVQAELGDFSPVDHSGSYLSGIRLLHRQTVEDERKVRELHKLHRGQLPADAEANFLEHAKRLDNYGVESHPAKDSSGKDIFIGVTSIGLVVFQNSIRINTFSWSKIVKISFKRKQFYIQLKREPSESYDTVLGFNMRSAAASKSLWKCSVEQHGFFRLRRPRRVRPPILGALAALSGRGGAPYIGRTECQALEDGRRSAKVQRVFVRTPSLRVPILALGTSTTESSPAKGPVVRGATARGGLARVTTRITNPPRPAWTQDTQHEPVSDDEGGFGERVLKVAPGYAEEEQELVVVRLTADGAGRYGFNVRGGLELDTPVVVSRVAPGTPAHRATPSIQEGDQVVAINGVDVEKMLHEQIVQLIRGTRGVLTLTLRPNAVYSRSEDGVCDEEPPVCFVPLAGLDAVAALRPLHQAMLLLGDGLASGAAFRKYESLPRRLPDLPCTVARMPENLTKNRYRDIAPYDSTRVVLQNGANGDYINASYINMQINNSDDILTYIATQGPLASTVGDFWQMVVESGSSLVVMLTVLTERGRAKCAQYWAHPGAGPLHLPGYPGLNVTTTREESDPEGHYVYRDIIISDESMPGGSRHVHHLQYLAWPDHGVPEDTGAFLDFTRRCSSLRDSTVPSETNNDAQEFIPCTVPLRPVPMVVHCSAGVGRTGALILAETALHLMSLAQPVYPLHLVESMREQRPMCVQNVSQYKFVCESIQAAYTQSLEPSPVNST